MKPAALRPYKPLPTDVEGQQKPSQPRSRGLKRTAFRIVAVVALMVMLLSGVRHVSRIALPRCKGGRLYQNITSLPSHYTLPSGDKIPSVALGVWQAGKNEVGKAVETALKAGYRHIDGAWIYRNEAEVGQALNKSGVKREDVWITSKLWNSFHAPEDIESTLDDSLAKLGTDYLDLYLIHWPVAQKSGKPYDKTLTENPYPTWQKLEEMVEKGKVRNIGVSNFNIRRLENLTANPLKIRPAVNQVEISYWVPQVELIKWAKEHDLLLEAYSPLGSTGRVGETLAVPEVKEIAQELGMTPAQVVISWHVQRGYVVLPKSVTPSRVEENVHVRALPPALFEKLETAATSHKPYPRLNPSRGWGLDFDIFD
ncbi:NADP-dependent oxidoreductase domain-containing protein [Mycena belliarum]|uniref:NADP-dependent oxidoreductase domain-containing protein n=1 Tax=Mycena belliarum TaxID=1033014 RepID=A0AAD6TVY3_9AGAR|nr:NADP-dependent oxidoreductase domain-containing protein [Mycena belliae]